MKTIPLLAVMTSLLVDVFGPKSSVGGPMTELLVSFLIMLAADLYKAWGRGPIAGLFCQNLAHVGITP
jgi:hypothetical protein